MKAAWIVAVIVAAACTGACGGKPGQSDKADKSGAGDPAAVASSPLAAGYEAVRDRFAHDDLDGARTAASALQKVADASMQAPAGDIAKAADIVAARHAFGELSKAYLTLLAAKPELGKGLYAFRCPMAEGYQKWVQVDGELKNPYMGSRMLECGSKVALAP